MKKILWLLLFSFSFSLFFTSNVDAAEILQSKGGIFSSPTIQDNKVRINLSGNVKYIRHTKYEQSSWNNPVAYKQLRANSSFTAFAYTCPGYYMTRVYSDSAGTQLIGWVRVYVDNNDISDPSCTPIYDTSKNTPASTKEINVTHPSDVVKEPSKMITQSTSVSPSKPVVRDEIDEDLTEFVAGQVDAATLSAERACSAKASSTGVAYQLKYNSNTSSWECVITSDCLYNSNLWHCNAQTVAQKNAGSSTTIDNPDRAAYLEDSCTSESCTDMYTLSNYSRPTNNVVNNGVVTTAPEIDYGDPYVPLIDNTDTTDEPYVQPVVNDPWLTTKTDGEMCYNPDGTPNYSATSCWCDDPDMQAAYSFCQSSTGGSDNVGMVEQTPDPDYCYYFGATDPSCPPGSYPEQTTDPVTEPEEPTETTHTQLCFPDRDPDCYSGTTEPEMTEGTTHTQLWFPDQDVKPTDPEPTNPETTDPEQPSCYCESMGDMGYLCCLWECPGWDEYLGFVTDTVEMAIGDITTPEVEPLPDIKTPSVPKTPKVDKQQLKPPTGKEDKGLDDASFDANDLKNVDEIQFRKDPGGFNITNPLEQLEGTADEAPQPSLGNVKQPQPTGGNADSNNAQQPQYNGGIATAPTTSGTAKQPDYSGKAKFPTYTP